MCSTQVFPFLCVLCVYSRNYGRCIVFSFFETTAAGEVVAGKARRLPNATPPARPSSRVMTPTRIGTHTGIPDDSGADGDFTGVGTVVPASAFTVNVNAP